MLEPEELMDDDAQARAYAAADFEEPNSNYVRLFGESFPDYDGSGRILDLGCGPADVTIRLARRYPNAILHGVDGSAAMLKYGGLALEREAEALRSRVRLLQGFVPGVRLPEAHYDVIVSNSLLHHLPDPSALWGTIRRCSQPGTHVFVGDLFRPESREAARAIVETHSADEPEVLKTDFYNSLLAAFTPDEVAAQLTAAGLHTLRVETISDRHLLAYGQIE